MPCAPASSAAAHTRGAAIVIDVETGDVLASVSYPWPSRTSTGTVGPRADEARRMRCSIARATGCIRRDRRSSCSSPAPRCAPIPNCRPPRTCACACRTAASATIRGWTRPVRDDPMDTTPHGAVDLHDGLVVSCNAYFAQLAMQLGPQPMLDAASLFQIEAARPSTAAALRSTLPHAGYGQADVLASPLKMARVVAAIAGDGRVLPARWTADDADARPTSAPRLPRPRQMPRRLARYMRDVVTSGTGRTLLGNATPIAGKTGTAEVDWPARAFVVRRLRAVRRNAPDRVRRARGERRIRRTVGRAHRRRDRQRRARARSVQVGRPWT